LIISNKKTQNGKIISLVKGDITKRKVDAIVNAANSNLNHDGGVAYAIVHNGGTMIQKESNEIGFFPVGSVAITTAGNPSCKIVIHVIGSMIGEGNQDEKVKNAVMKSLVLVSEKNLQVLQFLQSVPEFLDFQKICV
jgi:O-acetyl-ADP-ribose deacetylase (regulator of RNase III)